MAELPTISGKETIKAFQNAGWSIERTGSSRHIIMKKPGVITALSIPDHKTLDRGLLRSFIRDACLSIDEFCKLLKE